MPKEPDVSTLSYEQARDELVQVVARLEGGSPTLEESLVLWERGEALAARCQQLLEGARERVAEVRARTSEDVGSAGAADPDSADPDSADAGVVAVVRDTESSPAVADADNAGTDAEA